MVTLITHILKESNLLYKIRHEFILVSLILGIKDSSGIKFYVTPTLRKFDAGIMEVGIEYINKMAIPPRQKMFKLVGDCISECTNIVSISNKITIIHIFIFVYSASIHVFPLSIMREHIFYFL